MWRDSVIDVSSSVIGSAACVYTGQPFDTVKVRIQSNPGKFGNAIGCLQKTVSTESVRSLWRGSMPAFMGALSENAVSFGINGALKRILSKYDRSDTSGEIALFKPCATGAVTGAAAAVVLCPCDVIKCKAQVNTSLANKNISEISNFVLKTSGIRGFYRGFSAQLLRDIPFGAFFFGGYEIICQVLKSNTTWSDNMVYFMAGGFAGQLSWILTIAPDTVKSAIQAQDRPLTLRQAAMDIIRARGYRGLFAGVGVATVRAFPANAALFLAYEQTKKLLEKAPVHFF